LRKRAGSPAPPHAEFLEPPATFSIVVPTYRRPDALALTLDALVSLEYPTTRYEIIVVDDGPDAETERVVTTLDSKAANLRYVAQDNSGAAGARNRGARIAEGDTLLFCDDDTLLEPDHLRLVLRTRSEHADSLVNGVSRFSSGALAVLQGTAFGRYRIELDSRFEAEADVRSLGDGCYEASLLSARNLAITRDSFWELGGFDDAFPYAGAEDQALSLLARRAGLPLIRDHRIVVLNNEQILTFAQFCAREERSAQTFVVLVQRFPEQAERPLFAHNTPISRRDSPRVALKKLMKVTLSRRAVLGALHGLAEGLQRLRVDERLLRRVYRGVLGLHINRGVRTALRKTARG
jgi:glycosyltransferase involved in cell wall biosynthesis